MSVMKKRKDFPEWMVEEAYIRQDGVCANCGASLRDGFHRHHKDGNPANNSPDNLVLLCPDCHYITFKKDKWNEHKELEREVLGVLREALKRVANKELSGASLERMILAASKVLSISRHEKGLMDPVERLPELHRRENVIWADGYREGLKNAMSIVKDLVASSLKEVNDDEKKEGKLEDNKE